MVSSNKVGLSIAEITKRVESGLSLMAISPSAFNRLGILPYSDKWNALFSGLIKRLDVSGAKALKVRLFSSKQKKHLVDCYVFWKSDQLLMVETLTDCINNGSMEFVKAAEALCGNTVEGDA